MYSTKKTMGRDLAAPERTVTIRGEKFRLKFNNRMARIAEDVYQEQYGRDMGYYDIIQELAKNKHRAVMAVIYAAGAAGGMDITWEEFDEIFTLDMVDSVREAIVGALAESMPQPEPGEDPNGADAQGKTDTPGHG